MFPHLAALDDHVAVTADDSAVHFVSLDSGLRVGSIASVANTWRPFSFDESGTLWVSEYDHTIVRFNLLPNADGVANDSADWTSSMASIPPTGPRKVPAVPGARVQICSLEGHEGTSRGMCQVRPFGHGSRVSSDDGLELYCSGGDSGKVCIWKVPEYDRSSPQHGAPIYKPTASFKAGSAVFPVEFLPSTNRSAAQSVFLGSLSGGLLQADIEKAVALHATTELNGSVRDVLGLSNRAAALGECVVTSCESSEKAIAVWDFRAKATLCVSVDSALQAFRLSNFGDEDEGRYTIVSTGHRGTISIWDMRRFECPCVSTSFKPHSGYTYGLAQVDSDRFVSCCYDNTLCLWNFPLSDRRRRRRLDDCVGPIPDDVDVDVNKYQVWKYHHRSCLNCCCYLGAGRSRSRLFAGEGWNDDDAELLEEKLSFLRSATEELHLRRSMTAVRCEFRSEDEQATMLVWRSMLVEVSF